MRLRQIGAVLVVATLAGGVGCKKKAPPAPAPQQQAPTITQQENQVPPPAAPEPQKPSPEQTEQQPAAPTPSPETKPTAHKHKSKAPKKSAAKKTPQQSPRKPAQPSQQASKPATTDTNVQLSASIPQGEAARQRQVTAQLLTQTENTLKSITRALTDDEQRTVQQIRGFMQQSRTADNDGDLDRSYNLATKAKLLADELVKR